MATVEQTGPEGRAGRAATASDEELVRRVRAGETDLFETLMRRYNARLYRAARAVVKDDLEAEDVLQQAWVNAYAHLDQFAERARLSTWLTRIAVHEALGRVRRRRPTAAIDAMSQPDHEVAAALTSSGPSPEQEALASELRVVLEASIDALPEGLRTVFVLRDVEGLSTAEAAECLDLREDTVKTRLHRARSALRRQLFERAGIVTPAVFGFHLSRCDRVVAAVFRRLGLELPVAAIAH